MVMRMGGVALGFGRHRWGLGIKLLAHNPLRLAGAWAGLAVAVAIMFIQLGLLDGILNSQSAVASLVRGDLVVMNRVRTNLHNWNEFEPVRLPQIAALPAVQSVIPLYEGVASLRERTTGALRRITVFAFPAGAVPLDIGDAGEIARRLRTPGSVLFDRLSRPIYGAVRQGADIELDHRHYQVAGLVEIGPDIVSDGAVVMREGDWLAANPSEKPIMGIVRLKPGVDPGVAREQIEQALPGDITVMTPQQAKQREIRFTLGAAPIGILFGIGVLAGWLIGAITCYQTLFSEIIDRLPQYATLRAMGFSDRYLQRVIYEQAALLCSGAFAAGIGAAWLIDLYVAGKTALPIEVTYNSAAWTFVLTAGMTAISGWTAMRLISRVQPAELY